ncbi:Uncharacterized protein Fot_50607 [Forsythia ovata]|uniref:Uncharacterized protein n=1 Tax=Forsythia ovata TaxID=205694 RepID=A0ABD1Q2Q3_9LAMI
MTCSECVLQGHNKRYYLRGDASAADWYYTPLEHVENDGENPRHGKKKPHEAQSSFQFMPTPGVNMRNTCVIISSGPSASSPVIEENAKGENTAHVIRTEDININTMVEEL